MLNSDLLSYSIMSNGDKAVSHFNPHYASFTMAKHDHAPLPPITSFNLTENNLLSLNTHSQKPLESKTPSLTSSSSMSESPLSSPRSYSQDLYSDQSPESTQKKRRQRLGPSCDKCRSRKVKCNAEVILLSRNFERSGAESSTDIVDEYLELSAEQKRQLFAGASVQLQSKWVLVLSNQKLIKFKPCMSCAGKELMCMFSKGFTKEDILQSKRGVVPGLMSPVDAKSASLHKVRKADASGAGAASSKGGLRKSSCAACRKRKVKCVMDRADKCVGCTKKDISCTFFDC